MNKLRKNMNPNEKEKETFQEEDLKNEFSEEIDNETAQDDTQNEEETPLSREEELENQVEELTGQLDNLKDKHLRLQAEFDNFRKRTMKEKAELILNGSEKSICSFLPIIDDMERALKTTETSTNVEAIREGFELIYSKFLSILSQNGVKIIETNEQPLNTDFHEAIAVIPAPSEELKGKILDTVQTGYTMNDKVIRHAKVVVGD